MLRVGIIGAGFMGQKRAQAVVHNPHTKLCVVCDTDLRKARLLAQQYECLFAPDWRKVVADKSLDIIVAATTNNALSNISIAALKNKKHLFCEKPMGRTLADARKIFKAARQSRMKLKVGFTLRFHPALQQAFSLYKKNAIGRIMFCRAVYGHGGRDGYDLQWRMKHSISGGGELLDQGVHIVDLFAWFMGEFGSVSCQNANLFWKKSRLEDNAFIFLKAETGACATAHLSTTQWKNNFLFEVFGDKGYLVAQGLGGSYGPERLVYGSREKLGVVPVERTINFPQPDAVWQKEWDHFIAGIRFNRPLLAGAQDGLKASEIIGALYTSAEKGIVVRLGGTK